MRGGLARPSTGYAFQRIQRDSAGLADAIVHGAPDQFDRGDSGFVRFLDRVFLATLERDPDLAPSIFMDLFARAPTDDVVRFLSDRQTPGAVARVVAALPKRPFIRSAIGVHRPGRSPGSRVTPDTSVAIG